MRSSGCTLDSKICAVQNRRLMQNADQNDIISSKEILIKTGISRATLNNYIKMGILPRPMVMRPKEPMKGVKKLGYFPWAAVERIETVKHLKKQGLSMEEIVSRLQTGVPWGAPPVQRQDFLIDMRERIPKGTLGTPEEIPLRLTVDVLPLPAYLLNDRFDVTWANPEAMEAVFRRTLGNSEGQGSRNVFQWFFRWELHNAVQNWKDLLDLHMSYAKAVKPRRWLARAYEGISPGEREILEHVYDRTGTIAGKHIHESHINLLKRDGGTESYRILSMRFREGMLFVYSRREGFAPW